jgi:hypothetical protein
MAARWSRSGEGRQRSVAVPADRAYVKAGRPRVVTKMPEEVSISNAVAPRRVIPIVLGASIIGILLAATVALWAHYGTAVFFETIRAGFAACFG